MRFSFASRTRHRVTHLVRRCARLPSCTRGRSSRLLQPVRLLQCDRLLLLRERLLLLSAHLRRRRHAAVGRVVERRVRVRVCVLLGLEHALRVLSCSWRCELTGRTRCAALAAKEPDGLGGRVLRERVGADGLAFPAR